MRNAPFARLWLAPVVLGLSLVACSDDPSPAKADDDAGAADGTGTDGEGQDGTSADGSTSTSTTCTTTPKPTKAPGAEVCVVEKSGKEGILVVADVLKPGEVITGGSVLINADGKIACAGCDCDKQAANATWIICPDAVVSPGLIDAHNHVGWLNGKPWVAADAKVDPALRWEHRHDWRKGKRGNPAVNVAGGGASTDQKSFGELRYILTGSTAIFGSGDLGGLMRDLDSTGSGKNGLGKPGAQYDTFPLGDSGGTQLSSGCKYGTIHSAPGSSTNSFGPHVAEGIDAEARNEFLCLTGQGEGAVKALDKRAALIHAVGLKAADYALMGAGGMKMIWSPRSNVSLYGTTADVTLAHASGVGIGLGADWVPSGSINILRELQCAAYLNDNHYNKYFSDDQLWQMATIGGARALAMDDVLGKLDKGYAGDLAVFAKNGAKGHTAVINAKTKDVALVVRGGEILAGNFSLLSAAGTDCETLGDVCGVEKGVCIKKSTGKTYKELMAKIGTPSYPLFFCAEPDNEPSCVPARTLKEDQINGSTLYAGKSDPKDEDGDGIENDKDNCPKTFNPIRPLDDGKQPDSDADGKGDVCDVCPLDANTDTCTKFDPDDIDGDGKKGADDNCPDTANKDQTDKDGDGKGDACDECPDYKNEGSAGCVYDITKLKTDATLMSRRVAVKGLVVTAAENGGFFAQKDGIPAIDHGGIFVYIGSETAPKIGDLIDVSGATLTTFYSQKQLSDAQWTAVGTGKFEPRPLTADDAKKLAQTDKFDSVHDGLLVVIKDAKVKDAKPKGGSADSEALNEIELDTGLRVDDAMWPTTTPYILQPTDGQVIASIIGNLSYRNDFMKLLPRGPKDIALGPPEVLSLTPEKAFQFAGKSGATLPQAMTVTLSHAGEKDVEVEVAVTDKTLAEAVGPFTIKAGETVLSIPIKGLAPGKTKVTAKVKGGKQEASAELIVLDPNADPAVASLTPAKATLGVGTKTQFTVTLSNPAGDKGVQVALSSTTASAGTLPSAVTVTSGQMTATFVFEASQKTDQTTLTAKTSTGSATAEVAVVDLASLALDIGDYKLSQTASNKTWTFKTGTKIGVGGYVVIARNADKAAFEKFWGVTLGADTLYINSDGGFPSINGDETFSIAGTDASDGPTIALESGNNYQRKMPVGKADAAASWTTGVDTPGKGATPGSGMKGAVGGPQLMISEFSDASGSGNFNYEFVELYYRGP